MSGARTVPMPSIGFVPAAPRTPSPAPTLRSLVGTVLRSERTEQGRTLREVADDARISMAYLSEVERGRKEASSEILAAICTALGLRLVDLLGRVQWLLLSDGIDELARDGLGRDHSVTQLAHRTGVGMSTGGSASALALAG